MKELSIEAVVENVYTVTDFIDTELEKDGCPQKTQFQIDVAVDELFVNISSYAYSPGKGMAVIRYESMTDPGGACITFTDSGRPFNPLEQKEPDITLPASERIPGGLGVFLARKLVDDVSYEYRDGKNILSIKKYF